MFHLSRSLAAATALGAILLMPAQAAQPVVLEDSFEYSGFCVTGSIGPWTSSGSTPFGASCILPSGYSNVGLLWPDAHSGTRFLFLNNAGQTDAALTRTVNLPAGTYQLTFWMAGLRDVNAGQDLDGAVTVVLGDQSQSFSGQPGRAWVPYSWTVTGDGFSMLRFEADSGIINLDSLQIAAVPEPSSLVLGAFGLTGLLAWRRFRKNAEQ